MDAYIIIIALAVIIIISHFLNIYSEKTGVPSVLILILFGALLQLDTTLFSFEILNESTQKPLLKILGIGGLILILLEAALDLKINKTMMFASIKAFFSASLGLIGTAIAGAYILQYFSHDLSFLAALFYATPLSILSSAIIIPSTHTFPDDKKSFLIYESTFSDVLGLLMFQILISIFNEGGVSSSQVIGKLSVSIIFSIVISILLIYIFQKIKGPTKLFLLFSILILLYSVGEALHLSSLLIVLIFGVILNNYQSVFRGFLSKIIDYKSVDAIQDGFKIIIQESAFVVRTFFFILFGYYVSLESLLNIEVIIISMVLLGTIYIVRFLVLLPTLRTSTWPELFLSPRGLITILLFFSIPENLVGDNVLLQAFHADIIPGIFLFIILGSALFMSNALIGFKKLEEEREVIEIDNISEFLGEAVNQETPSEMEQTPSEMEQETPSEMEQTPSEMEQTPSEMEQETPSEMEQETPSEMEQETPSEMDQENNNDLNEDSNK
jgi:cell volume regulation protein A